MFLPGTHIYLYNVRSVAVFIPATESVLKSIHYAGSVISGFAATLRRHNGTLFKQDMEPKGDFLENHPIKILHWAPNRPRMD